MSAGVAPSGPYVIKGSTLPDTVPAAIKDIQPYIDGGNNLPALEFPVPGQGPVPRTDPRSPWAPAWRPPRRWSPSSTTGTSEKQAKQLNLPGW